MLFLTVFKIIFTINIKRNFSHGTGKPKFQTSISGIYGTDKNEGDIWEIRDIVLKTTNLPISTA